jgi:hypothetical protein
VGSYGQQVASHLPSGRLRKSTTVFAKLTTHGIVYDCLSGQMCVHHLHLPTAQVSLSALALKEPGQLRAGHNYPRGGSQGHRPRASASAKLARSHPCQQTACFLPCTCPPDFALPFRQTSNSSVASGHSTHHFSGCDHLFQNNVCDTPVTCPSTCLASLQPRG